MGYFVSDEKYFTHYFVSGILKSWLNPIIILINAQKLFCIWKVKN